MLINSCSRLRTRKIFKYCFFFLLKYQNEKQIVNNVLLIFYGINTGANHRFYLINLLLLIVALDTFSLEL